MTRPSDVIERKGKRGVVMCLGWCGQTFLSRDKVNIRFCQRCRQRRDHADKSVSPMLQKMHRNKDLYERGRHE